MLQMLLVTATKFIFYIFLLVLGVWCSIIWKTRRIRYETSQLYFLKYKPLPLIGHLYYFINKSWDDVTGILLDAIKDAVDKGIQTACVWIGPFPMVFVWGVEDVQKVLTSTATNEKAEEYRYLKFASGNGLLTAPNNLWRITRSHTNPLFHPRNLEQLTPVFNQNCQELVQNLSFHLDSDAFNVYEYTMKTALKSVCHLIYGPEFAFNMKSQEFNRLLQMVERIPEIALQQVGKPWLWNEPIFNYAHKQDLEELNNISKITIDTPIKETRKELYAEHSQETVYENETDTNTSPSHGPLNLLEARRTMQNKLPSFNDKDLKDEIITLYATGTDTAGLTVASCLVALAQYPDIQDKLYHEIELFVNTDEITLEDIRKMQYLDQVYNEILRITTIVPLIGRKCSEDLKLSDCTVPAGNTVVVMLAGLHMNPKIYPNPETFDPERFTPENCSQRGKNTFLPFSGGSRNCIGKTYAQLLVKLMIVHVVRQYKLFTDMDIHTMKKKWVITLVNSEGYSIKLKNRLEKNS